MVGGVSQLRCARHLVETDEGPPPPDRVIRALHQVHIATLHWHRWPADVRDRSDNLSRWLRGFDPGEISDATARRFAVLVRRLAEAAERHETGREPE